VGKRNGLERSEARSFGCAVTAPAPFTPTWQTIIQFLDQHLKK
jgi:hypothetical protein